MTVTVAERAATTSAERKQARQHYAQPTQQKVAAETVRPQLRDGRGSLLFTGGGLALQPSPRSASLSVGKAALRAYVQALHAQLYGTEQPRAEWRPELLRA